MIDLLASLFNALSPLWEMSLTAAYAAAIVALLRLVLKKRAPRQVLCLLWLVVFARLLIPVSLESPLSIVPDARQVQQITGQVPAAPKQGGGQTVTHQPAVQDPVQGLDPVQNPAQGQPSGVTADHVSQGGVNTGAGPVLTAPDGATPVTPQPEPQEGFPWPALLAGMWLAGALAMGGYGLVSYLRLKSRLYDAIRAQDGAWEHPAVGSPFILGMLRPKIYLPAGLYGMPRKFILCHERAHLRRLDHIVKPVCWLALALHWFNPFVWMAFLLMSRDIEAACDEAVIRRLGPKVKADYSATLLSLATNGRVPAPCPLAFDEGDAKGRIKNVLRYRRPALWIVVVSAVAAVMAAVCLLTDPVSAQVPDDPDPAPSASQGSEPSQPPEGDPIADPWMLEVLDGERTFFLRGAGGLTVDQLSEAFYGDEPGRTMAVSKVAVTDLDKDGVKEMVLWPSINGDDSIETVSAPGYIILRRTGDDILAFDPGFRSFAYLKEDGTFYWNSSAFEGGIATAAFPENIYFTLENVSWCEYDGLKESYFVDGVRVDYDVYQEAIYAQDHKPEVPWYVYEGGQLWNAPPEAPFRPDSLLSDPGPRDLTQEELEYFQEYFGLGNGGKVPNIRSMLLVSEYSNPRDIDLYRTFYHGFHYVPDISQAERDALGWNGYFEEIKVTRAEMDQTLRAYLGLGLEQTNKVGLDLFHYLPEYGAYYTAHTDFGGDWFTMRSGRIRGDGSIALVYDSSEMHTTRVALLEEAEQIYAHRLYYRVKANLPTDARAPYASVPQPAASPEPAPSAAPVSSQPLPAAPIACEHGLDNAVFEFMGGILVIYCEEDGTRYPVPAVTNANYESHMRGDFDGDGRIELAFTRTDPDFARDDGTLLMADVVDGQFQTYTFDPAYLADDFNSTVTYELVDEYQAMNFTYQGYGMQVDLSEHWTAMMTHGRSYYPFAYDRETTYTYDGQWAYGGIDMTIPIWLEGGFGGHICYLSWGLRYTGSGFQLLSGSFGYRMPQ